MSVALLSLLPLDTMGGGELYTVETAQAIAGAGTPTWIAAPVDPPPVRADLGARLRARWLWTDTAADTEPDVIEWTDVLARLAEHDDVWVHQYLTGDVIFDVIASVASDQRLLFTSLGFEPLRPVFADLYQPAPRRHFVEISAYAAARAAAYAADAVWAHAAIWRRDMAPAAVAPGPAAYMALGRVLPHKGLETTIDALAPDDALHVVGPAPDDAYAAFLRGRAAGKRVQFHGCLPRLEVQRMLASTRGLVSASTHRLFDGRRIEQPELLGLVLCEALRDGTLPITSDVPAFVEVMTAVGLGEWTFPEGDAAALRCRLDRLAGLDCAQRTEWLSTARTALARRFAWDDYWPRVQQRLDEHARCA